MNSRQFTLIPGCLFSLILFFSYCSKDKREEPELPIFGTCQGVAPQGRLTKMAAAESYNFKTNSGINITFGLNSSFVITHDNYPGFKLELWGLSSITNRLCGNHENLNGKHVKDRLGSRRTVVFPDGAKITLLAEGDYASPLVSISLYDGNESHYFNMSCKTLEYSSNNAEITQLLDEAEADGETATIEFSSSGALFVNIYNEAAPGTRVTNRVPLGEIFWAQPNRVDDYFDDTRLGHTRSGH